MKSGPMVVTLWQRRHHGHPKRPATKATMRFDRYNRSRTRTESNKIRYKRTRKVAILIILCRRHKITTTIPIEINPGIERMKPLLCFIHPSTATSTSTRPTSPANLNDQTGAVRCCIGSRSLRFCFLWALPCSFSHKYPSTMFATMRSPGLKS